MDCMCPTHFMKNYQAPVVVIGKVQEKKFEGKNIVKYKITDDETTVLVVCIIYDFKSSNGMTFKETHEEIEIGTMVEIYGRPGMSRNSEPILYGATIVVCEEECDCHDEDSDSESISDSEDSDTDYKPSESDEEDDSYNDEDSDNSEDSDDYSEKYDSDDEDSISEDSEITFEQIPMAITNEYIIYQGKKFSIKDVITGTPMQVSLGTEIGSFIITEQIPGKYIGIEIPANYLEPNFPGGYDIIIKEDYENVLDVLYRR